MEVGLISHFDIYLDVDSIFVCIFLLMCYEFIKIASKIRLAKRRSTFNLISVKGRIKPYEHAWIK